MKIFWIVLGVVCVILLAIIMLVQNGAAAAYNLFHKTKKFISWDPLEPKYDCTEDFWHR